MTTQNVKLGVAWLLLAAALGCDSEAALPPAEPLSAETAATPPPDNSANNRRASS